jgi:hypothetical protein
MIMVAKKEKPFVRAGKGTVVRPLTTRLYEAEIDKLYKRTREQVHGASAGKAPVLKMPKDAITQFVRESIAVALHLDDEDILDTDDVFDLGLDDVSLSELANILRSGARPFLPPQNLESVSSTLARENPSIERLLQALFHLLNSESSNDHLNATNGHSGTSNGHAGEHDAGDGGRMIAAKSEKKCHTDLPETARLAIRMMF